MHSTIDGGKMMRQLLFFVVLAVVFSNFVLPAALADPSSAGQVAQLGQLKPDVPKLDTPTVEPKPQVQKPSGPLQGKIHRDDKINTSKLRGGLMNSAGRFFGKPGTAKRGIGKPLQGQTVDNSLSGQAESGIGIIGVKFVLVAGRSPVINRVFPLTPAASSGMQNDDVIVAVDGVPTFGLSKEEVYDMIVGKPGTPVTLSVQRNGDFKVYNMVRMDLNDISDPFVRRDYMQSM